MREMKSEQDYPFPLSLFLLCRTRIEELHEETILYNMHDMPTCFQIIRYLQNNDEAIDLL